MEQYRAYVQFYSNLNNDAEVEVLPEGPPTQVENPANFRFFEKRGAVNHQSTGHGKNRSTEQLHTIGNLRVTTSLRRKILESRIFTGPKNLTSSN